MQKKFRYIVWTIIGILILSGTVAAASSKAEQNTETEKVIRVAAGTLVVHNDDTMLTEDGGRVEILPLNSPQSETVNTQEVEVPFNTIEVAPPDEYTLRVEKIAIPTETQETLIRIASGTLIVHNDGSMETAEGGQVEFLSLDSEQLQGVIDEVEFRGTEVITKAVPIPNGMPRSTCYQVTASNISVLNGQYKRVWDYCVNSEDNEVVTKITLENTSCCNDTPVLFKERLGGLAGVDCPIAITSWKKSGAWSLAPGAKLTFEPWEELDSTSAKAYVGEEWQNGIFIYSCFGGGA